MLSHRAMRHFTQLHVAHVQLQRVARDLQEIIRRVRQRDFEAANISLWRAQIFVAQKGLDSFRAILC